MPSAVVFDALLMLTSIRIIRNFNLPEILICSNLRTNKQKLNLATCSS